MDATCDTIKEKKTKQKQNRNTTNQEMTEENQHYASTTTIAGKKFAFFCEAIREQCELLYVRIFHSRNRQRDIELATTIYLLYRCSTILHNFFLFWKLFSNLLLIILPLIHDQNCLIGLLKKSLRVMDLFHCPRAASLSAGHYPIVVVVVVSHQKCSLNHSSMCILPLLLIRLSLVLFNICCSALAAAFQLNSEHWCCLC